MPTERDANRRALYRNARGLLGHLYDIFLEKGNLDWGFTVRDEDRDQMAGLGMTLQETRKARDLLAARGLVNWVTRQSCVLNERGVELVENLPSLDRVLPIEATGDTLPNIEVEGGFIVSEIAGSLAFMRSEAIRQLAVRDIVELRSAIDLGLSKAALLLCGSALEAVLLDVADRNQVIAAGYHTRKKYPDAYSLQDLIEVAVSENLVPPSIGGMAASITEHRDLIHPAAELRADVKVDAIRAGAMAAFLKVVVCELREAHSHGRLDDFEKK